jgi:hypothetical protein
MTEGNIRGARKRGRIPKQLLDELKEARVEGGSSGSLSLENSVWKRLRTSRKRHYYLNLN